MLSFGKSLVALLTLVPFASSLPSAAVADATAANVNYWFSFGDSYTTTGFSTTGAQPTVGNPLGNPRYPGYTIGGGANWVDDLTTVNNRSIILTYNYAMSGATIDANVVKPNDPSIRTIVDQTNLFESTVAGKPASAPWTSANALFSVWVGINDINFSYNTGGDRDAFNDRLLNAYFAQVQRLYNSGGRNFLFVGVPPVERSPMRAGASAADRSLEKTVIDSYNYKLVGKVNAFKAANPGVTTYIWDAYKDFTTILNSPTAYGFQDATSYGQPKSFWGDSYHPGAAAHTIFAQKVAQILINTPW